MTAVRKPLWTSPADIRNLLLNRWNSGKLLKDWLCGELRFPYQLSLKKPTRRQLSDEFATVRDWIAELHSGSRVPGKEGGKVVRPNSYTITWQTINLRTLGTQALPNNVCFDSTDTLFGYISKSTDFEHFRSITKTLLNQWPTRTETLISALKRAPFRALALADQWPQVIAVMKHLEAHPRPWLYIRQLSIPDVDTKFIENNRPLLNDLLIAILPSDSLNHSVEGLRQHGFERRFGLLYEQPLIRFRILDPEDYIRGLSDISLPLDHFHSLNLQPERVFITENKVNGLTFPDYKKSIVIFGMGYGVSSLMDSPWLARASLIYWGDIDTHGLNILNSLRHHFPNTESLLMNEKTLLDCRAMWVKEPEQTNVSLHRLTCNEQALYQSLLSHRWGRNVRLEQERIPYSILNERLKTFGH